MIKGMTRLRWSPAACAILLATTLHAQPADPTLAAIRNYARTYVESLPNYTATQFIKRKMKSAPAPQLYEHFGLTAAKLADLVHTECERERQLPHAAG